MRTVRFVNMLLRNAPAVIAAALSLVACADDIASPALRPSALHRSLADSAAHVETLTITPDTARVVVGRSIHLTAVVHDTAGAPSDGRTVRWASSDTAIATVDSVGTVTGIAMGAASITARSDSLASTAIVTVHDGSVYAVTIAPHAFTVVAGDTITLGTTSRDAQDSVLADRTIRWESLAPSIATIDSVNGMLTAVAAGEAKIVAADGARRDTATVTIVPAITGVRVLTALDTLEAYDTRPMRAVYVDSAGRAITHGPAVARRTLRWSSSDTTIARIDSSTGMLTGVDRGTVTITAKSDTLVGTATRVVIILYRSITSGTEHACDIASGGIAWCWGLNAKDGRIGLTQLTDTAKSTVPVRIPGDRRYVQLATYGRTTCGVATDGRAFCWGYNGWGMLALPTATYVSPTPVLVSSTLRFRSITAGDDFVCGLTIDDRAYCWGYNAWGNFGTGKTGSSTAPQLAAGGMELSAISAGSSTACGVTLKNETYCFGASGYGQIGDSTKISFGNTYVTTPQRVTGDHGFRDVRASNQYACALTKSGAAWCWGNNSSGLLGTSGLGQSSSPVAVSGGLVFRSITTGYTHACGVTTSNELYCWGGNKDGQLGNAAAGNGTQKPIRAAGDLTFAEASAANVSTGGGSYTCAISADRLTTHCWGRGDKGQLGNGTARPLGTPNPTPSIVVGQKPEESSK